MYEDREANKDGTDILDKLIKWSGEEREGGLTAELDNKDRAIWRMAVHDYRHLIMMRLSCESSLLMLLNASSYDLK